MLDVNGHGGSKLATEICCITLATIAVAIRLFCKIRHKQGIRADDYWAVLSLGLYWAATASLLWGTLNGSGGEGDEFRLMILKNPNSASIIKTYQMSLYLGFTFAICFSYTIKMSILFFYHRIFFVESGYKRASYFVMGLTTVGFIGTIIPNFLICVPLDKSWTLDKPGKCLDFKIYCVITGSVDVFLDFLVLVLPIRIIFTLQLPLRTKLAVAGVFCLGIFAVATNILRVHHLYQPHSEYVNYYKGERWSHIHAITAFVCACLPIYKPLWTSISTAVSGTLSRYTANLRSTLGLGNDISENESSYRLGYVASFTNSTKSGEEKPHIGRDRTKGSLEIDKVRLHVLEGSIGYARKDDIV